MRSAWGFLAKELDLLKNGWKRRIAEEHFKVTVGRPWWSFLSADRRAAGWAGFPQSPSASSTPCKGNPKWGMGFLASIHSDGWLCSGTTKKKPPLVVATKSPQMQPVLWEGAQFLTSGFPKCWRCLYHHHHQESQFSPLLQAQSHPARSWAALHLSVLLPTRAVVFSFLLLFTRCSLCSNEMLSNSWRDDRTISDASVRCQVRYAPDLSRSPLSTDTSIYTDTTSPSPPSFPEVL